MKKTLCLILAALMLSSSFVSCSDNKAENTPDDTTAAPIAGETSASAGETVETEPAITDDLPEVTFGGADYVIYNTNPDTNTWFTTTFVTFEEDTGEPIPSSIFYRNLAVEDRFDVRISEMYSAAGDVKSVIQAGSGEGMDMLLLDGSDGISFIQQKFVYDLNTMENINFDKPYWDQNARQYLSLGGKLFSGIGDFMTTHIDETVCMYFNKGLIDNYQLENPYELVDGFKWTYDKLGEMGAKVSNDTNGDGTMNDQDSWALMSWRGVLYPFLVYGSGESYMKKDENDSPYMSFYSDRFISAFEKIASIAHSGGDTFTYDAELMSNTMGLSNNHRVQEIMFPNNQVLFWVECVSWARALREMETDFGIITAPMLEESQQKYYNYCNGNFYSIHLPVTLVNETLERSTIITEALNSHSTDTVLKAYYDVSLTTKYSRDEETGRMLDLIFDNLVYDVSIVYDIASVNSSLYTMASENKTDVASYAKKNQKMMTKNIEKLMKEITSEE